MARNHGFGGHKLVFLSKPTCAVSWWIEADREAFTQRAWQEVDRMTAQENALMGRKLKRPDVRAEQE